MTLTLVIVKWVVSGIVMRIGDLETFSGHFFFASVIYHTQPFSGRLWLESSACR